MTDPSRTVKKIDQIAAAVIAVLIFLIPISASAVEISFGVLSALFITRCFLLRNYFSRCGAFCKEPILLALMAFYIICGLSIFFVPAPYLAKSFKAWITKWGEAVLLFVYINTFLKKENVRRLVYVVVFSAALVTVDGLYQRLTGVDFLRNLPLIKTDRFSAVTATFRDYNSYASYLIVVFFIIYSAMRNAANNLNKGLLAALISLVLCNLLFTYSRGAWLSVLLSALIVYWTTGDKKAKIFFAGLISVFVFLIFSVQDMTSRVFFILESGGDEQRFLVWRAAWAMFLEAPLFGKGLGLFMDFFPNYAKNAGLGALYTHQYAHNCYLQILVETGILGLAAFLGFIGQILWRVIKKLRGAADHTLTGFLAGFTAFLIYSFFDTQFYSLKISALFWVAAGMIVVYVREETKTEKSI